MPRHSSTNRNIRKLGKTGNARTPSYFVTLPIEFVRSLSWRDGQKLSVTKSRGKLVIEDLKD